MRVLTIVALALTLAAIPPASADDTSGIVVQVSPHTLLLGATQGLITVHADIAFTDVDPEVNPTLNGVEAQSTFADDCGNLVAKFPEDDVKIQLTAGTADLELVGVTTEGVAFSGTDTVNVHDYQGRR